MQELAAEAGGGRLVWEEVVLCAYPGMSPLACDTCWEQR